MSRLNQSIGLILYWIIALLMLKVNTTENGEEIDITPSTRLVNLSSANQFHSVQLTDFDEKNSRHQISTAFTTIEHNGKNWTTSDKMDSISSNQPRESLPVRIQEKTDEFGQVRRVQKQTRELKSKWTKVEDDDGSAPLRFVKFDIGDTIRLRCRIPTGPYLVMWNKVGLDYPLTIGTRRFSPDERVQVRLKPPDKWRLTITDAKLTDSGVYSCTTSQGNVVTTDSSEAVDKINTGITDNKLHKLSPSVSSESEDTKTTRQKNTDYYVTVVEQHPNDRLQVDVPTQEQKTFNRNKTITVTGPKLVFYGTSLELVCRVTFPSAEAKMNPQITLEWYHRGVRRRPSATRSGGVYIHERWLDSHLLESKLLVAWASEADAGPWICLERSGATYHRRGMLLMNDRLRLPNSKSASTSNEIVLSPVNVISPITGQNQPAAMYTPNDLAFDKIEVEIVDLPDPTSFPALTVTPTIPAFAVIHPGGKHQQTKGVQLVRESGSPGGLRSARADQTFAAAKQIQRTDRASASRVYSCAIHLSIFSMTILLL
ncbi:hypothetical protein EG68_03957 [Paragonimus skrjabini miyazakii]|uniref:Ig-like domain-containing protein n=1 Tax=Paragonimus skrjabini miyazakii TaxID=59628 RepID=A0A8S9YV79_9TREM|nr:hypothetical protein EG68_03957 [Paragonimus skrjabini miyazakii]